jgi:SpoVK/Ycf46/Vps4 family AAA+-type ATPase
VAVEVPKVSWSDVGGLEEVKARLREATEWAETRPDAMARLGATPPRGTLLYGPPGCSKTMLAKAVASEGGRNFLTIKGPELYSKWVGESEKAVRALFGRAKQSAPSVVFLDELDGLVGARTSGGEAEGGGGPDVHDRLLAQLLQEMDGLEHRGVAVMAATNRPDLVDPALLRPGRFDRLVYIPPPASPSDRAAIFAARLRDAPVAGDVSVEALGLAHAGYTGADIAAVCREAALAAIEERADAAEVAARHFAIASGRVKPSPPPSEATRAAYAAFERAGG